MQYKVFKAFMEFYRTHIPGTTPSTDDLKVYIKGGYQMRIGPCVFRYNWTSGRIEQIAGPAWYAIEFESDVRRIFAE